MRTRRIRFSEQLNNKWWQRWILNTGAILGTFCLLMAMLTLLFGLKPLVFASGSMAPGIPTGAFGLAVPTPVSEIVPGQVVSVLTADETRITHRVVENTSQGLILKGDANEVADLQPYSVATADRLFFSIPILGYVISWFSHPWAFFAGGLLCAYVIYLAFVRSDKKDSGQGRNSEGNPQEAAADQPVEKATGEATTLLQKFSWTAVAALVCVLALVAPLSSTAQVKTTEAAFASSATATSNSLTALTLPSVPGPLACATTGGILGAATRAEVTWNAPAMPVGARYAVRVQLSDGEVNFIDVPAGPNIYAFRPGINLLGLLQGEQTFQVKVLVVLTSDGKTIAADGGNISWLSSVDNAPAVSVKYSPGLLLVNNFSCV